jgi:hypothetical protein
MKKNLFAVIGLAMALPMVAFAQQKTIYVARVTASN